MTRGVKDELGLKKGIHRTIKDGEAHLRGRHIQLSAQVKKNTGVAKTNSGIKIAKEEEHDPKCFFQMYGIKAREKIVSLRANTGEAVEHYENMSTFLNNRFLSVSAQEDRATIPERVQVCGEGENLREIITTRRPVQHEKETLERDKSPGPDEMFQRA